MPDIKANAAVCEMCGGSLTLADSGENFVCQNCGLQYPKDWVRAKVQEITGTVRIDGPVQVEGMQSADKLSDNAETFIRLQKHGEALRLFEKMQDEYPHDYRGWWGAVRIRSDEFTDLSLNTSEYAEIISDARSAIGVSDTSVSRNLQSILKEYIGGVYRYMVKNKISEMENKKRFFEQDLNRKENEKSNRESAYNKTKTAYEKASRVKTDTESELKRRNEANKKVKNTLYIVLVGWMLFSIIMLIADFSFTDLLGYIIGGLLIPIGIGSWIENGLDSSVGKVARRLNDSKSVFNSNQHEYEQASTQYKGICEDIDRLKLELSKCDHILTELSKEQDESFKAEYISGKSSLSL